MKIPTLTTILRAMKINSEDEESTTSNDKGHKFINDSYKRPDYEPDKVEDNDNDEDEQQAGKSILS